MRGLARIAAVALVAGGVTFSLGALASAASGAASTTRSPSSPKSAAPSSTKPRARPAKDKTRTKKKRKGRAAPTAPSPRTRTTSRLTLAAAGSEGPLVDESSLPPKTDGACPPEMASVDGRFCVDKWEGSLVESTSGGDAIFPYTSTVEGHTVRAVSVPGAFPQGYISGVEATQACAASGKRLCTRVEWRKACVGPRAAQFGYGDARERGRCNDHGRSPMNAVWGMSGDSAPEDWSPLKMNDARLNALPGSLARTGEHDGCTNEYGVFDMVGNLHEWTSDPDGTFQGGYYLDTSINGDGCAYRTTAHDFGYHDYSTGFRCCADPR